MDHLIFVVQHGGDSKYETITFKFLNGDYEPLVFRGLPALTSMRKVRLHLNDGEMLQTNPISREELEREHSGYSAYYAMERNGEFDIYPTLDKMCKAIGVK